MPLLEWGLSFDTGHHVLVYHEGMNECRTYYFKAGYGLIGKRRWVCGCKGEKKGTLWESAAIKTCTYYYKL